jgi:hypothetical protein
VSWLPNSVTKGFSSPKIVWEQPNNEYGGYYELGTEEIIVVETEDAQCTIAHEFRHYTQHRKGQIALEGGELDLSIPYESMITKYFRSWWHEYDALLFEYKYAKTELNEWWLKKLVWEG